MNTVEIKVKSELYRITDCVIDVDQYKHGNRVFPCGDGNDNKLTKKQEKQFIELMREYGYIKIPVKTVVNETYYITVQKIKNDINGNLRYQMNVFVNNKNITEFFKGTLGRMSKKGLIFQSFNLSNDVNFILNNGIYLW